MLAVTTAIFFITTVLFGLMALRPQSAPINTSATRAAAQAQEEKGIDTVARRFGDNLATFDYRTLDRDIDRILDDATGSFETEIQSALGGDINVFRNAIREAQGQSTGEVKGVAVSSLDDDTATVFVFLMQSIRNKDNPQPRTQLRLLELTLVKTDGGWKVDNVANPARPAD